MVKGHLSTKVPNVRLRAQPQQPKASASTGAGSSKGGRKGGAAGGRKRGHEKQDALEEEEEEDPNEETTESLNNVFRPFAGVVVCFTGVRDKASLYSMATELGARVESSLTDTTTHLVACEFTSEKYKVSLSLGLPILTPDWIRQTHATWRDGGDVSLTESISLHRLPAFQGLRICLSGFPTGTQRDTMIALIDSLQGEYSGGLDFTCTHLISDYDKSDKIEFAKRVNADFLLNKVQGKPPPKRTVAKLVDDGLGIGGKKRVEYEREQVSIKIVRPEWFWDCVGAHGRWNEDEYEISRPASGITPKNVPQFIPPRDIALRGKDSTLFGLADSLVAESTSAAAAATPILVAAGDERNEPAVMKRRRQGGGAAPGASLVQDILGTAGPSDASTSKRRRVVEDDDDDDDDDLPAFGDIGKMARRASSDQALPSKSTGSAIAQAQLGRMLSKARSTSFASTANAIPSALGIGPSLVPAGANSSRSSSSSTAPISSPFAGLRFLLKCGMKQVRSDMERCIPILGGVIVKDEEKEVGKGVDYVIVKLNRGKPRISLPSQTSSSRPHPRFVTQHWVESCYRDDKLCPLESFRHHTPVTVPIPIPGAESIILSATKVPFRMQACMENLVGCLGGTYDATFSRRVTHLVCSPDEVEGQKYNLALKWGIPIVSPEWMIRMSDEGRIPELREFVLGASTCIDKVDRTAVDRMPVPELGRSDSNTSTNRSLSRVPSIPDGGLTLPTALGSTPTLIDKDPSPGRELSPTVLSPPPIPSKPLTSSRSLAGISSPSRSHQARPPLSPKRSTSKRAESFDSPLSPPQRVATSRLLNDAFPDANATPNPLPVTIITTVASSPTTSSSKLLPVPPPLQEPIISPASTKVVAALASGSSSSSSNAGSSVVRTDSGGSGGLLSAVAKGKKRERVSKAPALTDDLKEMIDRMGEAKKEPLLPAREVDERASKRKRVLGRPGRATRSPSTSISHSNADGLSPNHSPAKSTTSSKRLSPPPPVFPPATYHANSPPSSFQQRYSNEPEDGNESLRVVYDDPEARREKQRIMDALRRGEMARRGETWEEEGDSQEMMEGIIDGGKSVETSVVEEEESQVTVGGRRKSARVRK